MALSPSHEQSFRSVASAHLRDRYGVSLNKVLPDMDEGRTAMRAAMESGLSAVGYVEQLASENGFVMVSTTVSTEEAAALNMRRAALATFARENPAWVNGGDGSLYRSVPEGGVVRLSPGKSPSGGWAIKVDYAPDAELHLGQVVPRNVDFEELTGGQDIKDALARGQVKLDAGLGLQPGL